MNNRLHGLTAQDEALLQKPKPRFYEYCESVPLEVGVDASLDRALDESFPASDPVAISITRKIYNLNALVINDFEVFTARR